MLTLNDWVSLIKFINDGNRCIIWVKHSANDIYLPGDSFSVIFIRKLRLRNIQHSTTWDVSSTIRNWNNAEDIFTFLSVQELRKTETRIIKYFFLSKNYFIFVTCVIFRVTYLSRTVQLQEERRNNFYPSLMNCIIIKQRKKIISPWHECIWTLVSYVINLTFSS